jgi:hypothetical protein
MKQVYYTHMRDLLIIAGMCAAAIIVGAWLYLYVPASATDVQQVTVPAETESVEEPVVESKDVSFGVLGHGSVAEGVSKRKNYAIYSKEEYEKMWKLSGNTNKMPTVDFKKGYVIAVFAGERPTGGYAISVEKVTDIGKERHVTVLLEKPGAGCITTQALTSPYQIIRVPFSAAQLSHTEVEREVPCE